jgi:flagellar basal body-associated protein FliL
LDGGSACGRRSIKVLLLTALVVGVVSAAAIVGIGMRSSSREAARAMQTENLVATPAQADPQTAGES